MALALALTEGVDGQVPKPQSLASTCVGTQQCQGSVSRLLQQGNKEGQHVNCNM